MRCAEHLLPSPARFRMDLFTGNWIPIAQLRNMKPTTVASLRFEKAPYDVYTALIGSGGGDGDGGGSGACSTTRQLTVEVHDSHTDIVLHFEDIADDAMSYARVMRTDYELALVYYCAKRVRSHPSGKSFRVPQCSGSRSRVICLSGCRCTLDQGHVFAF